VKRDDLKAQRRFSRFTFHVSRITSHVEADTMTIGRLLRSSTTGFVFGCSVPEPDVPRFGEFVKAPSQHRRVDVMGLVYDIVMNDDPFVRQMVATPDLKDEYVLDMRQNRNIPIDVSVLTIGYKDDGNWVQALPPQPPITLDRISQCSIDDVLDFTAHFDYLRLVLESPDAPVDELIAISLRRAAALRAPSEQRRFLRDAGRELARLLSRDLTRLENLLRRIKP
jgi:hypothetical protein